ncbi:hypothetical protein COLO4_00984 [Corchorus olitorius]|uniref:Uncharacterized protein n=1 Tax=Corchorus olitorius TaxID=93759 RepID=A0A1R3L3B8_9ROSI|nr:hypothetical protein COLO4_00984 [Corchorus olitorius]
MRRHVVGAVEQVLQVQRDIKLLAAIASAQIDGHVAGQRRQVVLRCVTRSFRTHATGYVEAVRQIVLEPHRAAMPRRERRLVAVDGHATAAVVRVFQAAVQVGIARHQRPRLHDLARERQLQPARALRADRHAQQRDRIRRRQVGLLHVEQRGRDARAGREVVLRADLVVRGRLGASAPLFGKKIEIARGQVVAALLEDFIAQAGEHRPLRRKLDQVLHVRCIRLVVREAVVGRHRVAGHGRQHLQRGVEQVVRRGARRAGHAVALVLIAQLDAVQQRVLDAPGLGLLRQLVLPQRAAVVAVALVDGERDGRDRPIGDAADRRVVVAAKRVFVVAHHAVERPLVVEAVVQRAGHALDGGFDIAGARIGRAVARLDGNVHRTTAIRRHALVSDALVVQVIELHRQLGIGRQVEQERRRDCLTAQEIVVAEAARIFNRTGNARADGVVVDGRVQVELGALLALRADHDAHLGQRRGQRFLGHAIDDAAGRTAPVQHGRRTFQHLNAVDVGQIAEVERVVAQAVDVLVVDRRETANGHLIALRVAQRGRHARHVAQRVVDRERALVLNHRARHDVHRLRNLAQRHGNLRGGVRDRRVVARAAACALDRGRRQRARIGCGNGVGCSCHMGKWQRSKDGQRQAQTFRRHCSSRKVKSRTRLPPPRCGAFRM